MKLWLSAALAALMLGPTPAMAQAIPSDAPALALPGPSPVGFRSAEIVHKNQPDLLLLDQASGSLGQSDRPLPLAVWYPSATGSGTRACYRIPTPPVGGPVPAGAPKEMGDCGVAHTDAPVTKEKRPVVLLSHGLGGWATGWSQLAENLASKGYLVIAIDHRDRDATLPGGQQLSFAISAMSRPADQRFLLQALESRSAILPPWLLGMADSENIALVAYSMGGFGAIIAAGAGVTPGGALDAAFPGRALGPWRAGNLAYEAGRPKNLKALVLLAPFGGGLPWRAWTPDALKKIALPSLFIDGDQDDVVDFSGGVRWLFETMTASDRRLLVYQNARHNIAMDPTPSQMLGYFLYREHYDEPVWRSDRLLSINAHMITAFLGQTLQGKQDFARYLAPPTPLALDGQWPLAPGDSAGDKTATPEAQPAHWPGFHRRWAVGLELHTRPTAP